MTNLIRLTIWLFIILLGFSACKKEDCVSIEGTWDLVDRSIASCLNSEDNRSSIDICGQSSDGGFLDFDISFVCMNERMIFEDGELFIEQSGDGILGSWSNTELGTYTVEGETIEICLEEGNETICSIHICNPKRGKKIELITSSENACISKSTFVPID